MEEIINNQYVGTFSKPVDDYNQLLSLMWYVWNYSTSTLSREDSKCKLSPRSRRIISFSPERIHCFGGTLPVYLENLLGHRPHAWGNHWKYHYSNFQRGKSKCSRGLQTFSSHETFNQDILKGASESNDSPYREQKPSEQCPTWFPKSMIHHITNTLLSQQHPDALRGMISSWHYLSHLFQKCLLRWTTQPCKKSWEREHHQKDMDSDQRILEQSCAKGQNQLSSVLLE